VSVCDNKRRDMRCNWMTVEEGKECCGVVDCGVDSMADMAVPCLVYCMRKPSAKAVATARLDTENMEAELQPSVSHLQTYVLYSSRTVL